MSLKHRIVLICLCLLSAPTLLQAAGPSRPEMRGWGVRIGVADDPDAIVGGVHFNMGEISENLRFQPNIELGVGDNHTTLFATGALHYRFNVKNSFTPYAGGGLGLGFVDIDRGAGGDDTNFEVDLRAIGGLEWQLKNADAFFVELHLGFGDIHDTQVTAGWAF